MEQPGTLRLPYTRGVDRLIGLALEEDVGHGDITSSHLEFSGLSGRGWIVAKEDLVLAGTELVSRVFSRIDPDVTVDVFFHDGQRVGAGTRVLFAEGNMEALLTGERTALNFLQRMSGIATHVRHYADTLSGAAVRLVDTRKTVPGWRVLEKYAVRAGGAFNHRMGLYDGVLIKDNHIAAAGSITEAVSRIRGRISHLIRIEVETTCMAEVDEAIAAGADTIMLDNMADGDIPEAVSRIGSKALVEVSGRVDRDRIEYLAATGVDIISSGALTHAARFVDLSMDIERLPG